MHITLIGMPGAGKSTVGRKLAEILEYAFVDPDTVMEKAYGLPLQQVLDWLGPDGFLKVENDTVIACAKAAEPCVIAPGGSVVYSGSAMYALQSSSLIIHLEAPLQVIETRIGGVPRGIVGGKTLAALYAERVPLYRAWAMRTVAADRPADKVAEEISDFVRKTA